MISLFNRVVVLALLLAVPLIFCAKMDESFDLPKLILLYIGVISFWAGWLINGLRERQFVFKRSLLDMPLVAWLGVTLISSLLSIDPRMSFFGFHRLPMFGWFPMLAFAALFWAAVQVADRHMERVLAIGAVGVAILTAIYGLLQYYGYQIFPRMPDFTKMPILSSLGNPIFFGCYLMLVIPLASALFIETLGDISQSAGRRWKIFVSLGVLVLLIFTFILTFARGPWVGLGVGAIFYIAWILKPQMRSFLGRDFKKLVLLLTESIFVIVLIIFLVYPAAQRRLRSIFDFEEPDICSRIEGWKAGFYGFLESPIKGSGPDTFGYVFRRYKTVRFMETAGWDRIQMHAHNDFIQMATTTGIVGLMAYTWLWITILFQGNKRLRIQGTDTPVKGGGRNSVTLRGAWYASLLALFVQNQFNFSTVGTSAIAAIFAGMFFGSSNGEDRVRHSFSFSSSVSSMLTGLVISAAIVLCWFALRPARASLLYTKGLMNKSNGRWGYAIQDVQNALHLVPNNGAYRDQLLRIYRLWVNDERDMERKRLLVRVAVAQARYNARRHPYDSCINNNLGFILMWATLTTGEDYRTEAWASFRRAVELEPNLLAAWSNIAKLSDSMGDRRRAISILEKILKIKPDDKEAKELMEKLR